MAYIGNSPEYYNILIHTSNTANPHLVTPLQIGLGNVTNESKETMFNNPVFTGVVSVDNGALVANFNSELLNGFSSSYFTSNADFQIHEGNTNNPHQVTASQVGLGNVTNESKYTMFNNPEFSGNTTVENLTVIGTTTSVNVVNVTSNSSILTLASGNNYTDIFVNGGGLILKGNTDKSILWYNANNNWTSSESFNLLFGKQFEIDGALVLSANSLGSGIVNSVLTSVGNVTIGTWSGNFGSVSGENLTSLTAGNLIGTLNPTILGNSTVYVGTTPIALNRASSLQVLTGVSIDGTSNSAINVSGGSVDANTGNFSGVITSNVAQGTAPFIVSSNTIVNNLNVKYLNGQVGSYYVANSTFISHTANNSNPHNTSAAQVGLGNVTNTSDANKPVSSIQQTALNLKANLSNPTFIGWISSPSVISTAAQGVSPLTISSNTVVLNLNAQFLDGFSTSHFVANTDFSAHIANSNPHNTTASQVGLGNVTNESKATMFNNSTFTGNTVMTNLHVSGTITTVNVVDISSNSNIIILGGGSAPSDILADGGGVVLKGDTDKKIVWDYANNNWSFSEHVNTLGKSFKIDNITVLSNNSLGSGVLSSSLTSVGNITSGTWSANTISPSNGGTGFGTYTQGDILVANGNNTFTKIPVGSIGQVLQVTEAGVVSWSSVEDGGVY